MTPSNLYTDMHDYFELEDDIDYHDYNEHAESAREARLGQAAVALRIAAALVRVHSLTCDDIMKMEGDKE